MTEKILNKEHVPSRNAESLQAIEFANVHKLVLRELFHTGLSNEVKRTITASSLLKRNELRNEIKQANT